MIPRFQVPFGRREFVDLLMPPSADVADFERAFAAKFGAIDAVAFSYGRTAQWAFLRALGVTGAEIVMPAYTCSVVAHSVVLSGNIPVFVDISLDDYNTTPERVAAAISPRTRAVVATNTFGYPQDPVALEAVIADAEQRFGNKIWFIEDCAHAFGATSAGRLVAQHGDVALFGLNVSKIISSIFGGMLVFTDQALADRVRSWRDGVLTPSGRGREARQRIYGVAAMAALSRSGVSATTALASHTRLLDRWVTAHHLDDQISFPPDHAVAMTRIGATIGLEQLQRYDSIVARRRRNAEFYDRELVTDGIKAPLIDGATYSHYVVRVQDRAATVARWKRRGVQLGELIQYSIPHLQSYLGNDVVGFENSLHASRHLVNFPVDLSSELAELVVERSRGTR
jgi:dTDP-4-amino-4,6-dideoxygalactose transaminase